MATSDADSLFRQTPPGSRFTLHALMERSRRTVHLNTFSDSHVVLRRRKLQGTPVTQCWETALPIMSSDDLWCFRCTSESVCGPQGLQHLRADTAHRCSTLGAQLGDTAGHLEQCYLATSNPTPPPRSLQASISTA